MSLKKVTGVLRYVGNSVWHRPEVVGNRLVDDNAMLMYDRMKDPCCLHDVSLFEPCEQCEGKPSAGPGESTRGERCSAT